MAFTLPPLPFPKKALEPYMSQQTVEFHYGKHHKAYIDTTNRLIQGTSLEHLPLADIVTATAKDPAKRQIFNAAAQAWNHTFFWRSIKPQGGGRPTGDLLQALERNFGGYEKFRDAFHTACIARFGSGWGWLVLEGDKIKVLTTPNASNPLARGLVALLACDLWEHAYYLDFQDRRAEFVRVFLDHLTNWDHVSMQLLRTCAPSKAKATALPDAVGLERQ